MKQNVLLCALKLVHVAALVGLVAVGLPVAPESGAGTVIAGEVVDETPDQSRGRTQPKKQPRSKRTGPPPKSS